ncbi:MAG: glycosyltransferase [Rhizobacter sp.]|nr:glycosyltransferase [Chlorobiales bacterium]
MKNLLIVSYYFPPSGGPGVQRVLKFVKYLREFDIRPVVLTVSNGDYPARDESLLAEIPAGVKVYRTKIFEPYVLYRRLTGKAAGAAVDVNTIPKPGERRSMQEQTAETVRSNFFIPDARIGWLPFAVNAGMKIIAAEKIDCLYSSSPPYTCAVIARRLKKKSGLPWIAGFRDPWRGFLSTPVRHGLAEQIDIHLERAVFRECDAMEVAWMGIKKDFAAKYPEIDSNKCVHIENGFDDEEIPHVEKPRNEKFTVCYTGSMYGKRSPEPFLSAVRSLVLEGKVDAQKIKLKFVGRFGDALVPLFEEPVLRDSIEVKPYLPHRESILELLGSDALLLVVDDTPDSAEIVPGKVYEYIGTSRPVMTLALDGAISSLIKETNAGTVASFREPEEIKAAFLKYYSAWMAGENLWHGRAEEIKKYTRRESSRKLAGLVHRLTA